MHHDLEDVGTTLILKGIRRVAVAAHRPLIVDCPDSHDPETVRRWADGLLSPSRAADHIAGVILWATDDVALVPTYRRLIREGVRLVCIDRDPPCPLDADVVAVDHFRGARTVTEHLLNLGHRRIAIVGNDDRVSSVRDRTDGYLSALREAGIRTDQAFLEEVSFVHAGDARASCEQAIGRLFALASPPTGLFAVNDQIAMHLQDALLGRGIAVPRDVSVVGFDWFLRWLPSGGDLTTVAQPFEAIGQIAAERLIRRIEGDLTHPSCHVLLPAPLVVKSTTRALSLSSGAIAVPLS